MPKPGAVSISDHALVRWLERVHGVDMEGYRRHLAGLVQNAAASGACGVKIDGYHYMLRDGALVTVRPLHWHRGHQQRQAAE